MGILIGFFIIILLVIVFSVSTTSETPSQIGAAGEDEVSDILSNLPQDYRKINNIIIPTKNGTTQIDHIVVSPYGIFVIETKNYSGWIFGSNNSKNWKQTFKTESHYFYNPIKQNWAHIYALSELLNLYTKFFKPVVVFSDNATLNVESSTPVINMWGLKAHIMSFTQEILTYEQVEKIYNTITSGNIVGLESEEQHVQTVKARLAKQKESIDQGICPRCGGKLVLRNGKYGKFYGCSNYPKCRFTQDI